jgi:DNA-binding transcriptional MerR regulator
METRAWKVGELAKSTGLSIRTLHFYEEIGLLSPSARTESGHRIYGEKDLLRLQQILSLKQMGLPLDNIKLCLDEKKIFPIQIIQAHKKRIEEEKVKVDQLYGLLSRLEKALAAKEKLSIDEVIKTMEAITMYENMYKKYFTKEQLEKLSERRKALGERKLKSIQAQWPKLIKAVRAEMTRGTHPNDPKAQKLAKQWKKLANTITKGDIDLSLSFMEMYKKEPKALKKLGIDPKLQDYVGKIMFCLYKKI